MGGGKMSKSALGVPRASKPEVEKLVEYYATSGKEGLAARLRLMQDPIHWAKSDPWTRRESFRIAKKYGFVRSGAGQLGRGGRGRTGWAEQIGDALLPTAGAGFLCVARTQVAPAEADSFV